MRIHCTEVLRQQADRSGGSAAHEPERCEKESRRQDEQAAGLDGLQGPETARWLVDNCLAIAVLVEVLGAVELIVGRCGVVEVVGDL